jgi:site-specific recombinase XerD
LNKPFTALNEPHHRILSAYTLQLQRERYSRQTVRNYTNHFVRFLQHCDKRTPSDLKAHEIEAYIHTEGSRGLSSSTINVMSYSIRYYYERVLRTPERVLNLTYRKV